MRKEKMRSIEANSDYKHYIDSLKTVIRHTENNKQNLDKLQHSAAFQELCLKECLNNLDHLEYVQKKEYDQWQERAQRLRAQKEQLRLQVQEHSQALALSKAQIEHSLRMINLFPDSSASDYLKSTSLNKTLNETLRKDWEKVGDQLAQTMFELKNAERD
ncbi:hypothetical protein PVK62_17105 [Aliivibrio sp. S3MY1]|uniref:hypothetical protein n=1 Tax=unclassified Aliivibrio TaxID=2645654 RepID=UPI00076A79BB|nr:MULTISPECIES: hypothetical protein [unclassified Aliivibrio]MDD9197543.1 hypothetical protein [Aliivibrio sp. S3MY1]MDD9200795.1 hypothetical protein [Aliivibrio sp. S2MY1]